MNCRSLVALGMTLAAATTAMAQRSTGLMMAERGPKFFYTSSASEMVPLDVSATPVLRRRVSMDVSGVPLREALSTIALQSGMSLSFSPDVVNLETPVTLEARNLTVAAALTELLIDLNVDVVLSPSGQLSIVKQPPRPLVGAVAGRVIDSTSNQGVPRVTVLVEGTRLTASTGSDGAYTIANVPAGPHAVIARRLGYKPQTVRVTVSDNETATADFKLTATPTSLTEVVVSMTGDRQRLEVGNVIATVKADSLVATSLIRNMSDLLSARATGVVVQNSTGAVGSPSRVRIRGINSLQLNNDPIIILDGVRLVSQTTRAASQVDLGSSTMSSVTAGFLFAVGVPAAPSRLDDIDPNMIESLDILKGPSAAALYGTEAANGVIVIKTKRGQPGAFRFNVLADNGWSLVPKNMAETWLGWGRTANGRQTPNCTLSNIAVGTCTQDSVTHFNIATDPDMGILSTGTARNVSASLSGGTDRLTEFLSVRASDQVGMLKMSAAEERRITRMWDAAPPSWMKRPNTAKDINGSSRTNLKAGTKLDLSLTAQGLYRDVLSGGETVTSGNGSCSSFEILCAQHTDDTLRYLPSETQRGRQDQVVKRGMVSAGARYLPFGWLALRANLGGDFSLRTTEALVRSIDCTRVIDVTGCRSLRSISTNQILVRTVDAGAQFNFALLDWLRVQTSVGQQFASTQSYGLGAASSSQSNLGFGSELLTPAPVPISGTPQLYTVSESRDESATAGRYLEQVANIRDRLFLTAALRQDAASAFGALVNNNLPTFPKFSASWLASDEPFFPSLPFPVSLRLRTAYGHSGVQASQRDVLGNYVRSNATVDGVIVPGVVLSQIPNADLKPERTTEWEGGFDLSLFDNDRVQVEATTYRKLSRDAIMQRTLPMSYGNANLTQRANIGSVENKGIEFSVLSKPIDSRRFGWDLNVHVTRNRNKLVSGVGTDPQGFDEGHVVGYPLYGFWNFEIVSYQDLNGDGLLGQNEVTWSTGTPGVGRGFVYKGAPYPGAEIVWDNAFTLLSGALRAGVKVDHVIDKVVRMNGGSEDGRCRADPTCTLAQQALWVEANSSVNGSARKASYLRLSEVQATYSLSPARARRFLRAQSASITLAARNLGVWSNWTAGDPNVGSFDGDVSLGQSELGGSVLSNTSSYPQPRNVTVRLNLGF